MMEHKAKLLITGGAGFIGSQLADYGLKLGFDIHILDLPQALEHTTLPTVKHACDIRDAKKLAQIFQGMDYVIHAAANPNLWSRSEKMLFDINHQGTLNVIRACKACDVKRLVHISSDCTLVSGTQRTIHESSKTDLKDMVGPYCQSKWLAEKAVLDACLKGFNAVIVNPGVPLGKTSQNAPFVYMLHAFLHGKIKGYVEGNISLVDVSDVAECAYKALEHGKSGERYLAVSELWPIHRLLEKLEIMTDKKAPSFKSPLWLGLIFAYFQEKNASFTHKTPLATQSGLMIARNSQFLDHKNTKQALGLEFKKCEPALKCMVKALSETAMTKGTQN